MKTPFLDMQVDREWDASLKDNGFVQDAAYNFLSSDGGKGIRSAVLMVICTYIARMCRWVPLFYTISILQSADAYCQHFTAFFEALSQAYTKTDKVLTKDDVIGMVRRLHSLLHNTDFTYYRW